MKGLATLALVLCAFVVASAIFAQSPDTTGASILLPQLLVAGQPATLAVLGADGRLLPGAAVEFEGGKRVTTDATGRAVFRAPNDAGVMVVRLSGSNITATATVAAPAENAPDGVQIVQMPRVVMLGEPFSLRGSGFRGEADANQASLGGKPAVVLAASPLALVLLPGPDAAPGPTQLDLVVAGRSPGSMPLRLVALELEFDKSRLAPKQKGKLRVHVRGSQEPLDLEIRNLAPEIVRVIEGDRLRIRTRGGRDNLVNLTLEGLREGDYAVSARLVQSVTGLPDTEAARQQLLAALAIAPQQWHERVNKLIELLNQSPQNSLKVRNELEKLLAQNPPGEFGRKLEAAWRALLK